MFPFHQSGSIIAQKEPTVPPMMEQYRVCEFCNTPFSVECIKTHQEFCNSNCEKTTEREKCCQFCNNIFSNNYVAIHERLCKKSKPVQVLENLREHRRKLQQSDLKMHEQSNKTLDRQKVETYQMVNTTENETGEGKKIGITETDAEACKESDRTPKTVKCKRNVHDNVIHKRLDRNINTHIESIHKFGLFLCSFCNKSFSGKSNLNKHVAAVHYKVKPFSCTLCEKSFAQKRNLTRHVDVVHLKLKSLSCTLCNLYFARQTHLTQHENAVHGKLNFFSCTLCDYTFSLKSKLNKHVRAVHHNPFTCTLCDKSFASKCNLSKHIDIMHSHIKPLFCRLCNKSFALKESYINHIDLYHRKMKTMVQCTFACRFCKTNLLSSAGLKNHEKWCEKIRNQNKTTFQNVSKIVQSETIGRQTFSQSDIKSMSKDKLEQQYTMSFKHDAKTHSLSDFIPTHAVTGTGHPIVISPVACDNNMQEGYTLETKTNEDNNVEEIQETYEVPTISPARNVVEIKPDIDFPYYTGNIVVIQPYDELEGHVPLMGAYGTRMKTKPETDNKVPHMTGNTQVLKSENTRETPYSCTDMYEAGIKSESNSDNLLTIKPEAVCNAHEDMYVPGVKTEPDENGAGFHINSEESAQCAFSAKFDLEVSYNDKVNTKIAMDHGEKKDTSIIPECPGPGPSETVRKNQNTAPAFKCTLCKKSFNQKEKMKAHIKAVHHNLRPFTCKLCYKLFTFKGTMAKHVQTVHRKEKHFSCTLCKASFPNRFSLNQHIEGVHKKIFTCTFCNQSFTYKGSLANHLKAVHEKSKHLSCSLCDKSFADETSLIRHNYAVHLKVKPVSCTVCDRLFAHEGTLHAHVEAVHCKSFSCTFCEMSFCEKEKLLSHIKAVHQGGFFCKVCNTTYNVRHICKKASKILTLIARLRPITTNPMLLPLV